MNASNQTTVTVSDKDNTAVKDISVTVIDKDNKTATKSTDANGQLIIPTNTHNSYVVGYEDGAFKPENNMTRAAAAAKKNIFNDVPKSHWASDYIYSAVGMGWINGYSDGTFKPDSNITRAEVVTIVNRVTGHAADMEYINKNMSAVNKFTDLKDKSYWAFYEILEASNTHKTVDGAGDETWVK